MNRKDINVKSESAMKETDKKKRKLPIKKRKLTRRRKKLNESEKNNQRS
jgi:hypothetical protein